MNIPRLSIKNREFTYVVFIFLTIIGIRSFLTIPQREDPAIDVPGSFIKVIYPGASPADMEALVVTPIEEALNELDDIELMESTVKNGFASIDIEFDFGVDAEDKFDEVQTQINQVESDLPDGIVNLSVAQKSTSDIIIMQMALVSNNASYAALQKVGEELEDELREHDGVKDVLVEAYPEQEIKVALDASRMQTMNISLSTVENAIKSDNGNIPAGDMDASDQTFVIKTSGAYADVEAIRNTVVGAYQGNVVLLKDIANVDYGYKDPNYITHYNGEKAIFISVQQKEGWNIFDVVTPIKETIHTFSLPENMELNIIFDQSESVEDSVNNFLVNLFQGVILVGLIIFVALGRRASLLAMIAVPLSVLIGIFILDVNDENLQQISIAGFVVALGLLVDNSIAVLENIERYLAMGFSTFEAAIKGAQEMVAPLFSATLTTCLAFIPIITLPDKTGDFIRTMPIAVVATLVASYLIAVTITPLLASRYFKSGDQHTKTRFTHAIDRFVEHYYGSFIHWVLNHKAIVLSAAVFALLGALALFKFIDVSFFPPAEKPELRIVINTPNGTNLNATKKVVRYVEKVLSTKKHVKHYASNIGRGNPRIYYNTGPGPTAQNTAEVLVITDGFDYDKFYTLKHELRAEFASYTAAKIDINELQQGTRSGPPLEVKILGDNIDELQTLAAQVLSILEHQQGLLQLDNTADDVTTHLKFDIQRDKAAILGISMFDIDKAIQTAVNGYAVTDFNDEDNNEYDITLKYSQSQANPFDIFNAIYVQSVNDNALPLRNLIEPKFESEIGTITHDMTERYFSVSGYLEQDVALNDIIRSIKPQLDQLNWGDNSYKFAGELEERKASFSGMGQASIIAIILIFLVLVIQFKSFSQPLIILTALPFAAMGSFSALFLTGTAFSFMAFIGFISLIGIAVNDSIVLVSFANQLIDEGKSIHEAAEEAGQIRFAPVILTSLTTIFGLVPLTVFGGNLWAPMGITIIGGMITSTVLILIVVPILYSLFTLKSRTS